GGGLGLLLSTWGIDAFIAVAPSDIPRIKEISLDKWVLCFTLAVSLITGIIFGLAPALQASKQNLNESLKEGGRTTGGVSRNRMRSALVVIEVALSLVLLVSAGLLIESLRKLSEVNPGFDPHNLLAANVSLPRLTSTVDYMNEAENLKMTQEQNIFLTELM